MARIGTPLSSTATKVMLLGSGELGKEVVIELQRLGCEVIAVDRYANAPAMQVAHRSHVISMLDGEALRAVAPVAAPVDAPVLVDVTGRYAALVDGDPTTGEVNADGIALRQRIEDDTDRLTTLGWELLGEERSLWFAEAFEPPCEQLLARVDITAGPNYQPASRLR